MEGSRTAVLTDFIVLRLTLLFLARRSYRSRQPEKDFRARKWRRGWGELVGLRGFDTIKSVGAQYSWSEVRIGKKSIADNKADREGALSNCERRTGGAELANVEWSPPTARISNQKRELVGSTSSSDAACLWSVCNWTLGGLFSCYAFVRGSDEDPCPLGQLPLRWNVCSTNREKL